MFVISVVDKDGDERTFVATEIAFYHQLVVAVINGLQAEFRLEHILDIVDVDQRDTLAISKTTHYLAQRELI